MEWIYNGEVFSSLDSAIEAAESSQVGWNIYDGAKNVSEEKTMERTIGGDIFLAQSGIEGRGKRRGKVIIANRSAPFRCLERLAISTAKYEIAEEERRRYAHSGNDHHTPFDSDWRGM